MRVRSASFDPDNVLFFLSICYLEQLLLVLRRSTCAASPTATHFKGDLDMKTCKWLAPYTLGAGMLGLALAASGQQLAASYNIILKSGGAAQTCATGGFSFAKTTTGTFSTSGTAVTLNTSTVNPCFGAVATKTLSTGSVSVTVQDVTLNGQDQGPNVAFITGGLSSGTAVDDYTINFSSDKTFTVNLNTAPSQQVGNGTYFIFNDANAVPEPTSLWLILASLGALALARRARRS